MLCKKLLKWKGTGFEASNGRRLLFWQEIFCRLVISDSVKLVVGFLRNYTQLSMLAIKAFVSKCKMNSVKKIPPMEIEPGTFCDPLLLTELKW